MAKKIDHTKYTVGAVISAAAARCEEGKTAPPAYYTEASLLTAMKDAHKFAPPGPERDALLAAGGIGTARTRETPITELIRGGFIIVKGKGGKAHLEDSEMGRLLSDIAPGPMKSVVTTAKWEVMFQLIASGKLPIEKFRGAIKNWVGLLVKDAKVKKDSNQHVIKAPSPQQSAPRQASRSAPLR